MSRNEYAIAERLVNEHCQQYLTDEDRTLIHYAWFDLYFGPFPAGPWCEDPPYHWIGYAAAAERIEALLDTLPRVLYVDVDCKYVGTTEPEGYENDTGEVDENGDPILEWIEPAPYYTFGRADIRRAVLGKELAANL